jgi:hypothetical protein
VGWSASGQVLWQTVVILPLVSQRFPTVVIPPTVRDAMTTPSPRWLEYPPACQLPSWVRCQLLLRVNANNP